MPRGGKRPGAGRKKGAATKRTRATADAQAASGLAMPLDVLLEAMRYHHGKGQLDEAGKVAAQAAPYCHPRLNAVTHQGDGRKPIRVVEEIVIVDGNDPPPPAAAPGSGGVPA